jgi:hypothetical protein
MSRKYISDSVHRLHLQDSSHLFIILFVWALVFKFSHLSALNRAIIPIESIIKIFLSIHSRYWTITIRSVLLPAAAKLCVTNRVSVPITD